jgi:hypothetical protein
MKSCRDFGHNFMAMYTSIIIIIIIISSISPSVGPWPFFQFLDPADSR